MSRAGASAIIFASSCLVAAVFALPGELVGQCIGAGVFLAGAAITLAR